MTNLDDLIDIPTFAPVENLVIELLKPVVQLIPGLRILPWVENTATFTTPYVLVRRQPGSFASDSFGDPDTRFIQRAVVTVESFTDDPDGDEKGANLQEILRARIQTCVLRGTVVPGLGHITKVKISSPPHRANDWATSTGVVQYANLPKNMHRYEATYGLIVRPAWSDRTDPLELFRP